MFKVGDSVTWGGGIFPATIIYITRDGTCTVADCIGTTWEIANHILRAWPEN